MSIDVNIFIAPSPIAVHLSGVTKLSFAVIVHQIPTSFPFLKYHFRSCTNSPSVSIPGTTMVLFMLMASLNSCTNPWIYLAFSDSLQRHLNQCFRVRGTGRASSSYGESDSRFRSTMLSTTEVTRLESVTNGKSSAYQMVERRM